MFDKEEMGASLFSRTLDVMENDPLEEIFALNMGDFVSEFLISEELADKIGKSAKDKNAKLKSQLKELVSIYSLDNTLCVLGFSSQDEYVVYNSIAKTLTQILDVDACHIYLTKEFTKGLDFDNVFLPGLSQSLYINSSERLSRTLFMVAMTRSRNNLYLTHSGSRSAYLSNFADDCSRINVGDVLSGQTTTSGGGNIFGI